MDLGPSSRRYDSIEEAHAAAERAGYRITAQDEARIREGSGWLILAEVEDQYQWIFF
jgi:hypothetical protein